MKPSAEANLSRLGLGSGEAARRPQGAGSSFSMLALIGGVAGLLFSGAYFGVSAQPRMIVDSGAELQTLYATPEDVAQGKSLAESSCAGCHGADGISDTATVPHLAGQRSAYLFLELKAYQSEARGDAAMNSQVKFLSDDALYKVSAYYGSLDPPQAPAANRATAAADPVQVGKTAAAACAGCHGESGVSTTPGTPSLAGLDPKYTVAAMKAYKSGQRDSELMKSMLASLTDAGMENIALYYALQKPARSQAAAAGDKAAGAQPPRAVRDVTVRTVSAQTLPFPSLAGQDAGYLASALAAYKKGPARMRR